MLNNYIKSQLQDGQEGGTSTITPQSQKSVLFFWGSPACRSSGVPSHYWWDILTELCDELKPYTALSPMGPTVEHLGPLPDLYGLYTHAEWLLLFSSQASFSPRTLKYSIKQKFDVWCGFSWICKHSTELYGSIFFVHFFRKKKQGALNLWALALHTVLTYNPTVIIWVTESVLFSKGCLCQNFLVEKKVWEAQREQCSCSHWPGF